VSESAVSAKRGWGQFGAKPAQSETPVGAAAERRPHPEEDEVGKYVLYRLQGLSTQLARAGRRDRANRGFLAVRQSVGPVK
jgi:hypothetical protein